MTRHAESLATATLKPRQFGYLLAALMLATTLEPGIYLYIWLIMLPFYPVAMSLLLSRSVVGVSSAMCVDGLMVGLLISVFGFVLEVTMVLLALLIMSSLIVGGWRSLLKVLAFVALGATAGSWLHPEEFVGGERFYFVSFACLIAYVVFIGLLVFDETKTLKQQRYEAQANKSWLSSFVPTSLRSENQCLEPQRKRLAIFFSDIAGFTQLMDTVDESLVAGLLNDYFTHIAEAATKHGGTVDKFIGDGVMIFFGDTNSKGARQDAQACVCMALEIRQRFRELAGLWQSVHGGKRLQLRMGIHSGFCIVGSFGVGHRREYTALGSAVNLASRLENHAHGDEILVSQDIVRLTGPRLSVSPRGLLSLRGIKNPVPAWSVRHLSNLHAGARLQLLSGRKHV